MGPSVLIVTLFLALTINAVNLGRQSVIQSMRYIRLNNLVGKAAAGSVEIQLVMYSVDKFGIVHTIDT